MGHVSIQRKGMGSRGAYTHTHTQWLPHSHRFEYWMITEVDLKKEGWRDRDQMSEEIE